MPSATRLLRSAASDWFMLKMYSASWQSCPLARSGALPDHFPGQLSRTRQPAPHPAWLVLVWDQRANEADHLCLASCRDEDKVVGTI